MSRFLALAVVFLLATSTIALRLNFNGRPRPQMRRFTSGVGIGGGGLSGGIGGGSGDGGIGGGTGDIPPMDSGNDESISNPKQGMVLLWFTKLFEQYGTLLEKYPYLTKCISSGIVGGSGDILIQQYNRRSDSTKKFDWRRLLVFTAVAALYIAPVIHLWFGYLNTLPYPATMSNLSKAGIMILLDQTFGAVFITAGFFYAFELAQFLFPPYHEKRARNFLQAGYDANVHNLWTALLANWSCWPLINFVNFLVIPIQYRLLFSNFAAVFWNMFLSSVANRPAPPSVSIKGK